MKVGDYHVQWRYVNHEMCDKKGKLHNCAKTECRILDNEQVLRFRGDAICGLKDRNKKDKGRKESLKRAILPFTKTERTLFWEKYRTMTKKHKW